MIFSTEARWCKPRRCSGLTALALSLEQEHQRHGGAVAEPLGKLLRDVAAVDVHRHGSHLQQARNATVQGRLLRGINPTAASRRRP